MKSVFPLSVRREPGWYDVEDKWGRLLLQIGDCDVPAPHAAAQEFAERDHAILYAFDADGGFIAVCRPLKLAAYAYPTSDRATQAKRSPISAARAMLSRPLLGGEIMARVLAEQYSRLSTLLAQSDGVACCL